VWIARFIRRCRRHPPLSLVLRALRYGDTLVPGTIGERIYRQQPVEYRRLERLAEGDDVIGAT
jgi:hypothetical protein